MNTIYDFITLQRGYTKLHMLFDITLLLVMVLFNWWLG